MHEVDINKRKNQTKQKQKPEHKKDITSTKSV